MTRLPLSFDYLSQKGRLMTGAKARRWLWNLIRFAIVATLISFAAGALHNVIPGRKFEGTAPPPDLKNASLSIAVDVSATTVRGTYTLRMPKNEPLFLEVQHRLANLDSRNAAADVLSGYVGFVGLGKRRALFTEMPRFILDPKSPEAVISGTFRSEDIPDTEVVQRSLLVMVYRPWQTRSDECDATFRGHGVKLLPLGVRPASQSDDGWENVLKFKFRPGEREIRVQARLPEPLKTPLLPPRRRIGDLLARISHGYVDVLQPLAYGCVNALPFALFVFVFRYRLEEKDRFVSLAIFFAWLYLALGVLRALVDLFWFSSHTFKETLLGYPSLSLEGIEALSLVFIAAIWPWRVWRLSRRPPDELFDRLAPPLGILRIAGCLLAIGAMTLAISEEIRTGSLPGTLSSPQWQATLAAALLASLIWLAFDPFELVLTSGAFVAYFFIERWSQSSHTLRVAGLWLFAMPFALATMRLFALRKWRRLAVPVIAIIVLLFVWVREGDNSSMPWIVTSLAWELVQPLTLVLLAVLVMLLHSLSANDEWAVLESTERDAGTILMLIVLVLSTRNWLSVPIILGIGTLILRYWLFPNARIEAPDADGVATIRDLIRYNDARRALAGMKRDLLKSVGAGTMSFNDYLMKIDGMEAYVDQLAEKLGGATAPRAPLLSYGTPMRPWDRAVIAARYAFIAALPWMAVFVYNTASGTAPAYGYQWLTVAATSIFGIAQWPLYGFFLGYFYPHIRGRSGVGKGQAVFTLIALPAVIAMAITIPLDSNAWTSLIFWALQLFVMLLIVGMLAGDLVTLYASGLGWRHLFDVHDLGALTAYASTVVAAIGAAVTTFIVAQVPTVLTWTMQYFNAQPPK
jgi:hypothetical protein